MQNFTNKFTVVLNQDKTEAVLNFYQEVPVFPPSEQAKDGPFPTELSPVAHLVMTGQCAKNLLTALQNLFEREI